MRRNRFLPAAAIVLGLAGFPSGAALGQGCCTPGSSPLGGLGGAAIGPGQVHTGLTFDSFHLSQAYEGTRKVADPTERISRVNRLLAYARVGLPGQAVLVVEMPFDDRSRDQVIRTNSGSMSFDFQNRAPGDLSTLLMVRAFPRSGVSPWGVSVGAGIKWATGSVDREDDGRHLPVELQSGTGSTDPLLAATVHRVWPKAGIQASSMIRFSRWGRNDYRYGSEANVVAFGYASPWLGWAGGADLRYRTAGSDRTPDHTPANTGGWRLMAGPRITGTWRAARLGFEGALLWPIRQDLTGTQLGVDREFLLGLRWPSS